MKKLIIETYNCAIPLLISNISLVSIPMYEWWKGILLFLNFCLFGYIFYENAEIYNKIFPTNKN